MDTAETPQNPFTSPRFVIAAILMAFIVIFGIAMVFINVSKKDVAVVTPEAGQSSSASSPPTTTPITEADASICGLKGVVLEGSLSIAPETQWQYQDTTAYPISSQYGPGAVSEEGYRYCFQHSPEGALFMAGNAISQGTYDHQMTSEWLDYVVAEGPYREELLQDTGSAQSPSNSRLAIQGFRLLSYTGDTARADIAVRTTVSGQIVAFSGAYDLVWQDGDWKISTETSEPLNMVQIPDISGYIAWGE